jgi:hypothetical protein
MAGKKPAKLASAKPNPTFWTPKQCWECGTTIETMKDADRVLVKNFVGAKANTGFIWKHKAGKCA